MHLSSPRAGHRPLKLTPWDGGAMGPRLQLDPNRVPVMARSLARAGLSPRCSCAGCGECVDSAARLLRGVARIARPVGHYQAPRYGQRYAVYGRDIGPRRIELLADTHADADPQVIDVRVRQEPASPDLGDPAESNDEWEGMVSSGPPALPPELTRVPTSFKPRLDALLKELAGLSAEGVAAGWRYAGKWGDAIRLADRQLALAGLYCIQWFRRSSVPGQPPTVVRYLGMTSHRSIRLRLAEHRNKMKDDWERASCVVWVWPIATPIADPIRLLENEYLKMIAAGRPGKNWRERFAQAGYLNAEPELES